MQKLASERQNWRISASDETLLNLKRVCATRSCMPGKMPGSRASEKHANTSDGCADARSCEWAERRSRWSVALCQSESQSTRKAGFGSKYSARIVLESKPAGFKTTNLSRRGEAET